MSSLSPKLKESSMGLGLKVQYVTQNKDYFPQNEADAAPDPGVLLNPPHDGPGLWRLLGPQTPD